MIEKVFNHLNFDNGIWYTDKVKHISYPEKGNSFYFDLEPYSFWFNHRNRCIVNLVKNYSSKELFFDIGGGNGYVALGLQNAEISVVLIEPGIHGALNAKKRGLNNVVCGIAEDIGLKQNSIPSAGLFDVIEHIEDDMSFLAFIKSKLIKSGLLYITVPAYNLLWSKEDREAGHFRRYTVTSLKKKLKLLGFDVLFSTYLFWPLPLPIFTLRTLPSLVGVSSNHTEEEIHQSEHRQKSKLLSTMLDWEFNRIANQRSIPFGSSCLAVARKK